MTVPRADPVLYVCFYLGCFVLLLGIVFTGRSFLSTLPVSKLSFLVVGVAALLRLGALLAPTSLSDDVHRYAWDGALVVAGENPYREIPSDHLDHSEHQVDSYELLNSPEFYSIYPPIAQGIFAAGVIGSQLSGIPADRFVRGLLALIDLLTIVLIVAVLGQLRKPLEAVVLYAWNPLVVWEVAGGGHTEALMLLFLIAAVLATLKKRPVWLGLAIGAAALSKLTVLAVAPIMGWYLLRVRGLRAAMTAAAVSCAMIALGYTIFWFPELIENTRESLALYYGHFIFNAPIFDFSRWILGYREGVTPDVAHLVVPFFQAILLTTLAVAMWRVDRHRNRVAAGIYAVLICALLFTPVFHPWYLLPALAMAVLAGAWSAIALSALVCLSYLAYLPAADGRVSGLVIALQYVPFAVLLAVDGFRSVLTPIMRSRAARKYKNIASHIEDEASVLDIGAGEGYVGEQVARRGAAVHLVDVSQSNQTSLPHTKYDGATLPFDDRSFDIGLLGYVLHHCEDPRAVLRDSARVCKRLLVMESVYESRFDRALLTFLDHLANSFRGIPIERLRFDTVQGWKTVFEQLGLEVVEERRLGWFVHKHILFVLNVEKTTGLTPRTHDATLLVP